MGLKMNFKVYTRGLIDHLSNIFHPWLWPW